MLQILIHEIMLNKRINKEILKHKYFFKYIVEIYILATVKLRRNLIPKYNFKFKITVNLSTIFVASFV